MIRRALLMALAAVALVVGFHGAGPGGTKALAQFPTPSASPAFSCQFAGFNQFNTLINTGIQCGTPSPSPTGTGGGGGSVAVTSPLTATGSNPVLIGCLGQPLACGTVIQGPAYGMNPDSGTTDNGVKFNAAAAAVCGLGGGILLAPYYNGGNVYGTTTAMKVPCSNVILVGYGQGAGLGSPNFPTAVAAGTTFRCYGNLGGQPILSFAPTTAQLQAGNAVYGIGFDGNSNGSSDRCSSGLYITGQQQPVIDRLSFKHFSGPALHLQGSQIGGAIKGPVIFPRIGSIEISQPSPWDGPCMMIDALSIGGVDWGDVFGGDGAGAIHCIGWNWPRIIIGRSDHLNLPPIQVNQPPGQPTPSPNPTGSPPPTPFPDIAIICGAQNDHFSGVVMAQVAQYRAEPATAASPEATCAPPGKNPNGSTFDALQTYANSALPPGWSFGSLVFHDDYGDIFLPAIANDSHLPFLCLSQPSQVGGSSGCPGIEVLGDTLGNISIGVNGNNQTGNILFAPGGNGNSQVPNAYQSFIDSLGFFASGAIGAENASYGFLNRQLVMTATNASGDAFTFISNGATCSNTMFNLESSVPTPGPLTSVFGVDCHGNAQFAGGVQPNGAAGGYAAEVYPLGIITTHPRTVTGTCATVAVAGTVCTFPNGFAFGGNSYLCRFAAEGSTPHYFSYDTKNALNFKAYADSGTPTMDYSCTR